MKLSEFERALEGEFGAFGRVLLRETTLVELGNRTGAEALARGVAPREVWNIRSIRDSLLTRVVRRRVVRAERRA